MANIKSIVGSISGKVGGRVYYRAQGMQRERELVVPHNPRTPSQMAQRVKMANIAAIYRAFKPWMQSSFEIKKKGESAYNAFARNAIQFAPAFTKQRVAACLVLPQPCQVSRGTLLPIEPVNLDGFNILPAFGLGVDATVAAWSAAFIASYPNYQNGDVIAMVSLNLRPNADAEELVPDAYNAFSLIREVVLDTSNTTTMGGLGFALGNGGFYVASMANTQNMQGIGASFAAGSAVFGYRRNSDGSLSVSSSYLGLGVLFQAIYEKYRTTAAFSQAMQSYGVNDQSLLTDGTSISPSAPSDPGTPTPPPTDGNGGGNTGGGSDDPAEEIFIATSVNDEAMGSVTGMGSYAKGTSVTLVARPNEGYRFSQWTDNVVENPRTVIADTNGVIYTAVFEEAE